ncbi:MAG: LrgB family protein [Limnochordia bacterium]|jgi:predicted murein hydrolase (TIGR00659 family)
MEKLYATPIFGFALTIIAFYVGMLVFKIIRCSLANPLLIATVLIITCLMLGDIDYADYNQGGQIISFFLGPATVALAVPLYKNRRHLQGRIGSVVGIVGLGAPLAMLISGGIARLLGATPEVVQSLSPKSVTTPIAMEIAAINGGIPELTGVFVVASGLLGAIAGPEILRLFGINSPLAQGMAIGVATHGLGTARALQEGELTGGISGLAMGLAGLLTALVAPFIAPLF